MSEALVCDVCGSLQRRVDAGREGWLEVRPLADLAEVVPDAHPLHHGRHLCSTMCLSDFARAVEHGRLLEMTSGPRGVAELARASIVDPAPPEPGRAPRAGRDDGAPDVPQTSDEAQDGRRRPRRRRRKAAATQGDGPSRALTGVRVSQIVSSRLRTGDGQDVDLHRIASQPARARRLR